jgi:hypothetical protein
MKSTASAMGANRLPTIHLSQRNAARFREGTALGLENKIYDQQHENGYA